MDFTQWHHAFIIGKFYLSMQERDLPAFEETFLMAANLYGAQRGGRMAQRVLRDGVPLNFAAYRAYSEWRAPISDAKEQPATTDILNEGEDMRYEVHNCPWSIQFHKMGAQRCGELYCSVLDKAIAHSFNPALQYDVLQTRYCGKKSCIHYQRNAQAETVIAPPEDGVRSFAYHCAHVYFTFSDLIKAIYGTDGVEISFGVLSAFAKEYGRSMADELLTYSRRDFNYIQHN